MSSPLNFHLEQYDGPLDLLLDLIRKQQIKISDIPIAKITQQYLEYMQQAAEMNVELSAEFIYMAATLIHIKSKMLLPTDPELEKLLPEEDPRKELVDRLLETQAASGLPAAALSFDGLLHPPVVLARELWGDIDALEGDVGLRGLIRAHAERVAAVVAETPGGHPIDIDTREDFERLAADPA